jgi:tripartite-type tricarboxylate transporter receptor subunit TctC
MPGEHMRRIILAIILTALVPLCAGAAEDEKAIAEFYSKKTVTIAVGFSPGGNYDLYARLLARHIGQHIPGKPTVIVQNMPGAGSRRLANVLSNVGPHDGTMIGLPNQGIAMDQVIGAEGVQFDARKFHWIGSPIEEVNVVWVWHTNPVKSVEDAKQRELVAGATGPGSPTYFYPRIMNTLIGTRFKVVSGYPGSNELDLAIEKGEVGGRVVGWSSLKITSDWVATRKANVLLQFGLRKAPELANVRLLTEVAGNESDRQVFEFLSLAPATGRPFFMSPSAPVERVDAVRKAFVATLKDPAMLEEARRSKLEISPLSGDELTQIVAKMFNAPAGVIGAAKAAME